MTKPNADHTGTEAYLDGLAGRPGAPNAPAPDHAEGARLRIALQHESALNAPQRAPDWADVLTREAANEAKPPNTWTSRPAWAALAAGVAVCAVLAWSVRPSEESAWRGGAGDGEPATWISPQPQADAAVLTKELQALGALVVATPLGAHAVGLAVQAPPDKREAINTRLAVLDTALDANGRVRLRVQADPMTR
jgi:hypothetical protein